MDFITELPTSNGCTQIWVIVDTFTKQAHFIPYKDDTKESGYLIPTFIRKFWRLYGVLGSIILDRDSRFTAKLWADILKYVGI